MFDISCCALHLVLWQSKLARLDCERETELLLLPRGLLAYFPVLKQLLGRQVDEHDACEKGQGSCERLVGGSWRGSANSRHQSVFDRLCQA